MTIDFFVAGTAKSTVTGSVVRAGNRLIPIRRHTEWAKYVKLVAAEHAPATLLEGPISLSLEFVLMRPKSVGKRRGWPIVRPDLSNLAKGFDDALTGILWKDDAQIVRSSYGKVYGDRPGVQVTVSEMGPS